MVQDGTGPAAEAFKKLGISAQDLIDKSPEDMLLTVVAALQNVTNEADRKFLADELLGGSSEKLAGLLNLTNEELAAQLQHLADTGDFMSRDALDAANEYSQGMDEVKGSLSSVSTVIGTRLIKDLNFLIKDIKKVVDGVKQLGRWLGLAEKDTNEFTEAADEMAETLGDGTAPAIVITTEAAEEAAPAVKEVGKAAEDAEPKVRRLTEASDGAAESVKLWAAANRASSQQMIEDSALRLTNLLSDYGKELVAERELVESQKLLALEFSNTGEAADALAYDIDLLDGNNSDLFQNINHNVAPAVSDLDALIAEMTQQVQDATAAEELQEAALAALPPALRAAAREMGLFGLSAKKTAGEIDEATSAQARFNAAVSRDLANSQNGLAALTNVQPGGGRTSGRPAGRAFNVNSLPFLEVRRHARGKYYVRPDQPNDDMDMQWYTVPAGTAWARRAESWLQQNAPAPGAQHGAAVRGSRYGSLVRVGENFTNENITPVGRNGGGSGQNQGGRREYPIYIGDEKLTTLVLNAQNELEDTGRA